MIRTEFVVSLPTSQLKNVQAYLSRTESGPLPKKQWVELMRETSFALGCIVTLFENELPESIEEAMSKSEGLGPLHLELAKVLSKPQVPTSYFTRDIIVCIAACQEVISKDKGWA